MAKLDETFWELREKFGEAIAEAEDQKERIRVVLSALGLDHPDILGAVFALSDFTVPSLFPPLRETHRFADGATTAQIACHVGILQRGQSKLDREGRDYWIKPLRAVGAVEPITFIGQAGAFVSGHVRPKSPYSAYRLSPDFVELLRTDAADLDGRIRVWISENAVRDRLAFQKAAAAKSESLYVNEHGDLIQAVVEFYVPRFLPGFEVLHIDLGDGDRIGPEHLERLDSAGIKLTLGDAFPDVILFNQKTGSAWFVEAVTSDGEVDLHKVEQLNSLCDRSGISLDGLTTAYDSFKDFARRQAAHANIAPRTYVWIRAWPGVQFFVVEPNG